MSLQFKYHVIVYMDIVNYLRRLVNQNDTSIKQFSMYIMVRWDFEVWLSDSDERASLCYNNR